MNVVYNSEHYSILAYPAQESFELVDKEASRTLFIRGEVAFRFRQAIDAFLARERPAVEAYARDIAARLPFRSGEAPA